MHTGEERERRLDCGARQIGMGDVSSRWAANRSAETVTMNGAGGGSSGWVVDTVGRLALLFWIVVDSRRRRKRSGWSFTGSRRRRLRS